MNTRAKLKQALSLCEKALERKPNERTAFLSERCGDDAELRRVVDSILVAIEGSDSFLDWPSDSRQRSMTGLHVGDFRVLERIAEGGMGTVYAGERADETFPQKVAIKFVHQQLLTNETIRRFDVERAILGGLRHPYIAQLIDGGTTADGLPYLIMEFVDGVPIDVYCDAEKLTLNERLKLTQKIALAVQAAHQNLIVHRDLKPSNVLVVADGIPKLLDFGIAKLVDPAAEVRGNTTVFGRQALTPDFASPEQILEGRVTTASDVYSLGILTYQLLTGSRPYSIDSTNIRGMIEFFESNTIAPMRQTLQHLDSNARDEVAKARSVSPDRMIRSVSNDLENIVAKALCADPRIRYASVHEFSEDIERYLNNRPIAARKSSVAYRASKFVARNKLGVAATSIAVVAVLTGMGVSLWQANNAQAQLVRAEAVSRYLSDILVSPSPNWDAAIQTGAEATISDVLLAAETQLDDDLLEYPEIRIELYHKIGEALSRMEDHDAAVRIMDKALLIAESEIPPQSEQLAISLYRHAYAQDNWGNHEAAIANYDAALALLQSLSSEPSVMKLYVLHDMAFAYRRIKRYQRALELQEEAVSDSHKLFGEGLLPIHTNGYNSLGVYQFDLGMLDEAERSFMVGLEAHELYADTTKMAGAFLDTWMSRIRVTQLDSEGALYYIESAVDRLTEVYGKNHREVRHRIALLSQQHVALGDLVSARDALQVFEDADPAIFDDASIWIYYSAAAAIALAEGDYELAVAHALKALTPEALDQMNILEEIELRLVLARAFAADDELSNASREFAAAASIAEAWLGPDAVYSKYVRSGSGEFLPASD